MYLKDAGRRNNVSVVGIPENVDKWDLSGFVLNKRVAKLCLDVKVGFELEPTYCIGLKLDNGRILAGFLRISAREATSGCQWEEESQMTEQKDLLLLESFLRCSPAT